MITPQNSSGEYPPMGVHQRNGPLGGKPLELINSGIAPSVVARNRMPSLSNSTLSSVDDEQHPTRHGSFYPGVPPNMPYPEANPGGLPGHGGDMHGYPLNPMGQHPEWSDNVQMGMRQPFDMYNKAGAFLASPAYSSMEHVQPNYTAYNSRNQMMPSSGLSYEKMSYPQDSLSRQQVSYGYPESFQGTPALRTTSHEQARDPFMHGPPNYDYVSDRRPMYAPFQQSSMREVADSNFVSLFGSPSKDRESIPQDPYTIHDMRAHESYRTAASMAKAQTNLVGGGQMNPQYTFPNMAPQSYRDPRSYPNMNGGFQRHPQGFVNPNNAYSFSDPNMFIMGDGSILHKIEHQNMGPNKEVHVFHDQPVPVVADRLEDNLVLMQSSLHISSQASVLRDPRQYRDMEASMTLRAKVLDDAPFSSDPSKQLQQGNILIVDGKHTESTLFTSSNGSAGMYLRTHDEYKAEQATRITVSEGNEDAIKVSPVVSSVRTQDKSYLTVLQSSGTQKDSQIQSPSPAADTTSPKWKQSVINAAPPASISSIKLEAKYLYNVKFKRATEVFALDNQSVELKPGSFVKVEADRGHDMGTVVSRMPFSEYDAENRQTNASERFDKNMLEKSKSQSECTPTLKKILRLATLEEITLLEIKRKDEDDILNQCKTKAKQRGLTMNVIDAEYQFDRNKLTFFFQAQGRVDFRDLVKDLFGICKTRIWMQQIDKKPMSAEATG